MQHRTALHHQSKILCSEGLSEKVCMACLLPDCDDQDVLCLRAYVVRQRTAKADVNFAITALDEKLSSLFRQGAKAFSVAVLCEARDRLAEMKGNRDA